MRGMVAAAQPLAAEEAVLVLRNGGNAVDAAVAAAMVQGVIDPLNCGIGGFGWMHIHLELEREDVFLDFSSRAGSLARPDVWADRIVGPAPDGMGFILRDDVNEIGYQSIGVPGVVLGLHEGLVRHGTRTWGETLGPAIEVARNGYAVPGELAQEWRMRYAEGRPDALRRFTCTRAAACIYTKGQRGLLEAGDLLKNEDLARCLETLREEGAEAFYRGPVGDRIARDLEANGSLVTREDLEKYQVEASEPLRSTYRGYTVATAPPPTGGITLLQILNILEAYDLSRIGFNTVEYIHLVSQAMKAGFADRNAFVGDPAFTDVPVDHLVSDVRAAQWRDRIDRGERIDIGFDRTRKASGTTHISVVDEAGNCVSLTHTCGLCSGVVTPGLGFLYNNYMIAFDPIPGGPNSIAPGKKRLTGSSPTILYRQGTPFMVVGAPGGTRIISAVLQTILNVVDHGMTMTEAVSAPRFDCQGDFIHLEGRIPRWTCEALKARGNRVVRDAASYGIYPATAARVHAVLVDHDGGVLDGAADPRGYGVALSV